MARRGCTCAEEATVAAGCARAVADVAVRLRRHFQRPEAAAHAADYLRGLLADVERKNGWQLAAQAGYDHPRGLQRVLDRYAWDADAVRDDLRTYVVAALGDPQAAQAVLVVDETGFPKQGTHSAAVARQYCGTLGKRANCQMGVFLGYASATGHVGLDRALYLPKEWTDDRPRCRQAGIPDAVPFQTKPQLALALVERALDAGVPAAWVVADEVYGNDGTFRRALETRDQAYVVAVRSDYPVSTWPPFGPPAPWTVSAVVTAALAAGVATWARRSCGEGAQGPRVYDWLYLPVRPAVRDEGDAEDKGHAENKGHAEDKGHEERAQGEANQQEWVHAVLVRRHPERADEVAYYLVSAPAGTPLEAVVRVAGARWTIEDTFKQAKGLVGLDQYEVRSWRGWYRHVTLALLALAVLRLASRSGGRPGRRRGSPAPSTSRSASRKSAGSSSASCGPASVPHPPTPTASPGPVGGAATRNSPRSATSAAA
jgi:SRSO17 transposase